MLNTILTITLISFISFFPIVIWAYIFSYIDDSVLSKKRFLVGILGGVLSVFPILYMDKILDLLNFKYLNIFYFISEVKGFFSSIEFGFSLSIFLLLLVICSFVGGFFIKKTSELLKIYLKNIIVFLIFIFCISIIVYLVNRFLPLDFLVGNSIYFGDLVFNSFKLILFYYLLVAFIEETSKHFNFLQSSVLYIDSVKTGVMYSIFVALGFSFVENILYLYSIREQVGFSSELIKTYFFRSIFSVIVHVFASSVVAYYFSRALLLYRGKDLSFPYIKIFFVGLSFSILLHLFFDVALTLGFSFVMILYFVGGYLYVSSIFYKD